MTPVSHALLPVFFGQPWLRGRDAKLDLRTAGIIAFCGVLPDVLNPHLSLDSRHTSLSHTLWAWLIVSAALCAVASWSRRLPARTAPLGAAAYGGHLGCDAITGGVAILHPLSSDLLGRNFLPYWLWIACDGALVLYFYVVLRWLPLRRRWLASRDSLSP